MSLPADTELASGDLRQHQSEGRARDEKEFEYAKFPSFQDFFNHRRHALAQDLLISAHSFHHRLIPNTLGELVWPLPPGRPRETLSAEAAWTARTRRKKDNSKSPQFCLRRWQLMTMWNKKLRGRRQKRDFEKVSEKMMRLSKKYKLQEAVAETDDPPENSKARKRAKGTRNGHDRNHEHAAANRKPASVARQRRCDGAGPDSFRATMPDAPAAFPVSLTPTIANGHLPRHEPGATWSTQQEAENSGLRRTQDARSRPTLGPSSSSHVNIPNPRIHVSGKENQLNKAVAERTEGRAEHALEHIRRHSAAVGRGIRNALAPLIDDSAG